VLPPDHHAITTLGKGMMVDQELLFNIAVLLPSPRPQGAKKQTKQTVISYPKRYPFPNPSVIVIVIVIRAHVSAQVRGCAWQAKESPVCLVEYELSCMNIRVAQITLHMRCQRIPV
jgi:hypothetical protein